MLYAIYAEDGSIHQANKVFDPDTLRYDDLLNELGHKFVKVQSAGLVPPEHWYVDTTAMQLCERPIMPIAVDKTRIQCGQADSALLTNVPKAATVKVLTGGVVVFPAFVLNSNTLEISIPVPCIYRVVIDLWPFKTFSVDIEAVAA